MRFVVLILLLDSDLVVNVLHAGDIFGDVFGDAFGVAVIDRAGESHFAGLHLDVDFRGVDLRMFGETLVDVLADALIGPLPVLRTAS